MSVDLSGEITAIATAVLAAFAFITAILAGAAFVKQSREVRAIERQVRDQEELTKQQTELLEIQGRQLELQQKQFDQQAEERRRAQACRVFIWTEYGPDPRRTEEQLKKGVPWDEGLTVYIKNASDQPVYDLTISWRKGTAPWGEPGHILVLMPGDQEDQTRIPDPPLPSYVAASLFGAVARFRDAAGTYWRIRPNGQLNEYHHRE